MEMAAQKVQNRYQNVIAATCVSTFGLIELLLSQAYEHLAVQSLVAKQVYIKACISDRTQRMLKKYV